MLARLRVLMGSELTMDRRYGWSFQLPGESEASKLIREPSYSSCAFSKSIGWACDPSEANRYPVSRSSL